MKTLGYTIISVICFCGIALAQIPNPGFEQWNSSGLPNGWSQINDGRGDLILKSTDAHSGSFSVEGQIQTYLTFTFSPGIFSGYFPMTGAPSNFTAYYKFNPAGGDSLVFDVTLYTHGGDLANGDTAITGTHSSWTKLELPMNYGGQGVIDSALIYIYVNPIIMSHAGTVFYLDDFAFTGNTTGIEKNGTKTPIKYKLYQNYPNPFNPSTNIKFSLPKQKHVHLGVYDMLGRKVAVLINSVMPRGEHSADWKADGYPSGVYIYRLRTGDKILSGKMMLLK